MNRFLLALAITSIGACHIISGGDEIVVEDEEGGTTEGSSSGPSCSSEHQCFSFDDCFCSDPRLAGFECTDPTIDPDPIYNCVGECEICE